MESDLDRILRVNLNSILSLAEYTYPPPVVQLDGRTEFETNPDRGSQGIQAGDELGDELYQI